MNSLHSLVLNQEAGIVKRDLNTASKISFVAGGVLLVGAAGARADELADLVGASP